MQKEVCKLVGKQAKFKAEYDGEIVVIVRNLWKVKKENKEN